MDNHYGGIIWTNHALQRLRERGIKQSDAWATWKRPDHSRYGKSEGGWIHTRKIGRDMVEVVAKKNERGEWLIVSVWSKPAIYYKTPKHISFWAKLLRFFWSEE